MALIERTARVAWRGTLASGAGSAALDSGAGGSLRLDEASRTETAEGATSPEELLAAAHGACYAMALALVLTRHGHRAEELDVVTTCALEEREVGFAVSRLRLEVRGKVDGLDAEGFTAIAREAEEGCPISNAVRGNVPLELTATL